MIHQRPSQLTLPLHMPRDPVSHITPPLGKPALADVLGKDFNNLARFPAISPAEASRHLEWQPRKKGSAYVSLPFDGALAEELKNHFERETYLATDYGRPFASSGSLDNRVRKWIIAAGLCVEARAGDRRKSDLRRHRQEEGRQETCHPLAAWHS